MSWSAILETVIGLSFIFLVLSLIASGIQEAAASLLRSRARYLRKGLENLLRTTDDESYGAALLDHELVQTLSREYGRVVTRLQASGPSYLPASIFRKAFLDRLSSDLEIPLDEEFVVQLRERLSSPAPVAEADAATQDATQRTATNPDERPTSSLCGTRLGEVLRVLAATSDNNLTAFRREVEHWYDAGMERVTGWYKRNTQLWLFIVGLLLAAGLNADAIRIGTTLYRSPEARARIVAAAENFMEQAEAGSPKSEAAQVHAAVERLRTEMAARSLPIGWRSPAWPGLPTVLRMIAGWLIMAVAVTFGAPFWFDTLQRFVNLRGAGKEKGNAPAGHTTGTPASSPNEPERHVVYRASSRPRR